MACFAREQDNSHKTPVFGWRTKTVKRIQSYDGQTMTEYALILAAIAIVVVSLYQTSGIIVQTLLGSIDGSM